AAFHRSHRRALARRDAASRVAGRTGHRASVRVRSTMRVYIIGAGPGDPKLLTLRGAELIASCPVVLYTGSLVPPEVVAHARLDATVLDSSGMTLDEIVRIVETARDADEDVARVHTGDPL